MRFGELLYWLYPERRLLCGICEKCLRQGRRRLSDLQRVTVVLRRFLRVHALLSELRAFSSHWGWDEDGGRRLGPPSDVNHRLTPAHRFTLCAASTVGVCSPRSKITAARPTISGSTGPITSRSFVS